MDMGKDEHIVAAMPDWVIPDPLTHIPGIDDGPDDMIWNDEDIDPSDQDKYTAGIDMLKPRIWTELDFELEGDMAEDVTEFNQLNDSSMDATWSPKKQKSKKNLGKLEPKTEGDKILLGFVEQIEDDPEIEHDTADRIKESFLENGLPGERTEATDLWTSAPLSIRERFKQWQPIKDYPSYLVFMRDAGATTALSEEAFNAKKLRTLQDIFADYNTDQEELYQMLDDPLVKFHPDHAVDHRPDDSIDDELNEWGDGHTEYKSMSEEIDFPSLVDPVPSTTVGTDRDRHVKTDGSALEALILRNWTTTNMKRGGRRRTQNALCVVGNFNGAAGFAIGKAEEAVDASSKAMQKAGKRLVSISRRDGHTIHENVSAKVVSTQIYMQYAPEDHGLVAHPAIQDICRLAGIRNLIANVKRSKNLLNIVRATFVCLDKQTDQFSRLESAGITAVEYNHRDGLPIVKNKVAVEDVPLWQVGEALKKRVSSSVSRYEVKRVTFHWMKTFPLRPTAENFELARLINHGILLEQNLYWRGESVPEALSAANDLAASKAPELTVWLQNMPELADPSFSIMYPEDAETMYNCQAFGEMEFDDNCLYYHEELGHHLNKTHGNTYLSN